MYVPEKIIQNGDGAVYLDFFIPAKKLCIEVDGKQHLLLRHVRHDAGRGAWLLRMHGIKTVRFPTDRCTKGRTKFVPIFFRDCRDLEQLPDNLRR